VCVPTSVAVDGESAITSQVLGTEVGPDGIDVHSKCGGKLGVEVGPFSALDQTGYPDPLSTNVDGGDAVSVSQRVSGIDEQLDRLVEYAF
jgi:hypothetical protein